MFKNAKNRVEKTDEQLADDFQKNDNLIHAISTVVGRIAIVGAVVLCAAALYVAVQTNDEEDPITEE